MTENPKTSSWLFISDVDDTLLGDKLSLSDLSAQINEVRESIVLVYNSSRPCASIRKSIAHNSGLLNPDYLIGALGTEIQFGILGANLDEYRQYLSDGWNRAEVAALMEEMGLTAHPDEFQTPLKASYYVNGDEEHQKARTRLAARGIPSRVIFSGGKNLDIIPTNAGKGNAAEFLRRYLKFAQEKVVVAGDSANDYDLFEFGFKGIIVANAEPDLKDLSGDYIYQAGSGHAGGVLEGLRHWKVLPAKAPIPDGQI
jgi:sucrose-6-phosphatase